MKKKSLQRKYYRTSTMGVNFLTQGHLPAGDFSGCFSCSVCGELVTSPDPMGEPQNPLLGPGQVQPLLPFLAQKKEASGICSASGKTLSISRGPRVPLLGIRAAVWAAVPGQWALLSPFPVDGPSLSL